MKAERKVVSSGPVTLHQLVEWEISSKTFFSIERMYGPVTLYRLVEWDCGRFQVKHASQLKGCMV